MNCNNYDDLIQEYNRYFNSYLKEYPGAERQAESFKILSALKNVQTTVSDSTLKDLSNNK